MDLLFRLSRDVEEFENIENAKIFFKDTLPKKNNYYFYYSKKILKLRKNDQIYFLYDNYIIAHAIFSGETKTLKQNTDKYIHGYKTKNIQVLDLQEKLNCKIVHTRNNYIDSEAKKQEVNRILNSISGIYPDEISLKNNRNLKEGAKVKITVNAYERNPKARQLCLEEYGYNCFICGFNFENNYGEIGSKFIHVHHLKALAEIQKEYEINPIEDLRPICPNCHAMLHRNNPACSIEKIKKIVNTRSKL